MQINWSLDHDDLITFEWEDKGGKHTKQTTLLATPEGQKNYRALSLEGRVEATFREMVKDDSSINLPVRTGSFSW